MSSNNVYTAAVKLIYQRIWVWTERLFLLSLYPTNQESEPIHPGRENDRLVNKFELRSAG